jgi:hypothetical protein
MCSPLNLFGKAQPLEKNGGGKKERWKGKNMYLAPARTFMTEQLAVVIAKDMLLSCADFNSSHSMHIKSQ